MKAILRPHMIEKPSGDWLPTSPTLKEALKLALPFVGNDERQWLRDILVDPAHLYAADGMVAVQMDIEPHDVPSFTVPHWMLKPLVAHPADIVAVLIKGPLLAIEWADGTWISSAERQAMPREVADVFATWVEADWTIPEEWKEEFKQIARSCESGWITVRPEALVAERGVHSSMSHVATPVDRELSAPVRIMSNIVRTALKLGFDCEAHRISFAMPAARGIVGCRRIMKSSEMSASRGS